MQKDVRNLNAEGRIRSDADSEKASKKLMKNTGFRSFLGVVTAVIAMFMLPCVTANAYEKVTTPITAVNKNVDAKNEAQGWEWKASEKRLILKDGFMMDIHEDPTYTGLNLKVDTTIELEGKATIRTGYLGINALGDFAIVSAKGKNGRLTIDVTNHGKGSTRCYGIYIEQSSVITVRDAELNLNGGDACICSTDNSEQTKAYLNVASCGVVNMSADEVSGAEVTAAGLNNVYVIAKDNRVLYDAANAFSAYRYMTLSTEVTDGQGRKIYKDSITKLPAALSSPLKILAVEIESAWNEDFSAKLNDNRTKENGQDSYELTYDGKEHPVKVNRNELPNIQISSVTPAYKSTKYSEWLEDDEADYRDKETVDMPAVSRTFTEMINGATDPQYPTAAGEYKISYKGREKFAELTIKKRKVVVKGLKAKNKTYDCWPDAEMDYSALEPDENEKIANISCLNDYNGLQNEADEAGEEETAAPALNRTGIVEDDIEKLGTQIIPYAKAYFITEATDQEPALCTINSGKYVASKDVAYVNGKVENGVVDTKKVYIKEITLSNPNYEVVLKDSAFTLGKADAEDCTEKSQAYTTAKIFARDLNDDNFIGCRLEDTEKVWSKDNDGQSIWKEVGREIWDTSLRTPISIKTRPDEKYELEELKDYTISTNTYNEIGKQVVVFTGRGNYRFSITASWTLKKAKRDIYIVERENRSYDGTAYKVVNDVTDNAAVKVLEKRKFEEKIDADEGFKNNPFAYMIIATTGGADGITPTKENVTPTDEKKPEDTLEADNGFTITYEGINGTTYEKSSNAPVDAGSYKVTVSVAETVHYLAAEKSMEFTIFPKIVSLDWSVAGAQDAEPELNPATMIYNGTPNVMTAVVSNKIIRDGKEDTVNVTEYKYNGTTAKNRSKDSMSVNNLILADGTANTEGAPKDAGEFRVGATKLDNPNYTVEATYGAAVPIKIALTTGAADYTLYYNNSASKKTAEHNYSVLPREVDVTWNKVSELTFSNLDQTPVFKVLGLCKDDTCEVRKDSIKYTGTDVYGDPYKNPYTGKSDGTVAGTACATAKTDVLPERKANSKYVAGGPYVQDDLGAVNVGENIVIEATELNNPNYVMKEVTENIATITIIPLDLSTLKASDKALRKADEKPAEGVELWARYTKYTGEWIPPVIEWKKGDGGEILQRDVTDGDMPEDVAAGRGDYSAEDYTSASEPRTEDYTIIITGRNNYTGTAVIRWNVIKIEEVFAIDEIRNFTPTAEGSEVDYTVEYGQAVPEFVFSHANRDILNDNVHDIQFYTRYLYEGRERNGAKYKSSLAPTQAGTYKVTVTLIETDHYGAYTDSRTYTITPKTIQIISGISGVDKQYDGTSTATLSFKNIRIREDVDPEAPEGTVGAPKDVIGVLDQDVEEFQQLLASDESSAYFTYPSACFYDFAQEKEVTDVKMVATSELGSEPGPVEIKYDGYAINTANKNLPKLLYNYVIDENDANRQAVTTAVILPREVKVSGYKAKDRTYDGTVDVVLDTKDVKIEGVIEGQALTAKAVGKLVKTGTEEAAKDVLIGEDGKPAAKKVAINVISIDAVTGTSLTNYTLAATGQQEEATAVISPAKIRVTNVRAADKVFDNTDSANDINWSNAQVKGAFQGDFIILQEESADYVYPKEGSYLTPDVEYDWNGEPAYKKVSVGEFTPAFKKGYFEDDYVLDAVEIEGKILPKTVAVDKNTVTWNFDEETQLPEAVFNNTSDVAAGDDKGTDIVVEYFKADDTGFVYPVKEEDLKDGVTYVARITGLDNPNYTFTEDPEVTRYTFTYDLTSVAKKKEAERKEAEAKIEEEARKAEEEARKAAEEKRAEEEAKRLEELEKPAVIDDVTFRHDPQKIVEPVVSEKDKVDASNALNNKLRLKQSGRKLTVTWGEVKGAFGYHVYVTEQGKKYKADPQTLIGENRNSYTVKGMKSTKKFKAYVVAYKVVDGKEVVLAKSYELKCAGKKVRGYNVKKLENIPNTLAVSLSGTGKIEAKAVLTGKKKVKPSKAGVVYWSTDTSIAEVSADGTITGLKKGSCYVYVMARNGIKKKIKVSVG